MDNTLTVKLLPAALICKNFIDGMDNCNYEIYLREVVNASAYFRDKANGKEYTARWRKHMVSGIVFLIVTLLILNCLPAKRHCEQGTCFRAEFTK